MKYLIEVNCGDESTGNINVVYAIDSEKSRKEVEKELVKLYKSWVKDWLKSNYLNNSMFWFYGCKIDMYNFQAFGKTMNTIRIMTLDEFWQSKRKT